MGTDKSYGVAVIGGTGSNFYGKNRDSKEFMAPGLGYILADEGSGYLIGSKMLRAAIKSSDGRGQKTIVLENIVKKKFKIKDLRELANIVYEEKFEFREIASLTWDMDEAIKKKDKVAKKIMDETINEVVVGIIDVIEQLNMKREEFEVICAGGVFRVKYPVKKLVEKKVLNAAPEAKFVYPKDRPVMGAVKMAIDSLNS